MKQRIFVLLLALVGVLALSACASAPSEDTVSSDRTYYSEGVEAKVAEEGEVVANAEGSEIVCRKVRATGSHFPVRVCRTVDEWNENSENSRNALESRQRSQSFREPNPQ